MCRGDRGRSITASTANGGVPLGKYRVQVDARQKTGRKVQGNNGLEMTTIDEEVRMGPAAYAGDSRR